MSFTDQYLSESAQIVARIDRAEIDRVAQQLLRSREAGGRLFILGVGGSAANASHAVNDFRKLAGFEAYTPTDNVSELTARVNDDGWQSVFVEWLRGSRLEPRDVVMALSVGGGNALLNVSPNLVSGLDFAKEVGAAVVGVVGRDGGHTAQVADACVLVPVINAERVTAHTESFQAVVLHLLVCHPLLKMMSGKWESIT
ncbi:SIS domain-containing protein [Planctomycetota bacterium]